MQSLFRFPALGSALHTWRPGLSAVSGQPATVAPECLKMDFFIPLLPRIPAVLPGPCDAGPHGQAIWPQAIFVCGHIASLV